jgi:WD40 repeat protein
LPTNLALSGALVDSTQAGEFILYNLDTIRNRDQAAPAQEVVSIKKRPGRSSSLSAGIFHIAQRPGTNQLAVTTLSTEAHILRLLEKNKNKDEFTTNTSDDVDMMGVEENGSKSNQNSSQNENNTSCRGENSGASTSWELDVEYNLKGHTGGCAAVRICNNKAVTACFDGCLRVFDLPQISSNCSYNNNDDVFNATTSTTTINTTKSHGSYTTTTNTNNITTTNAMYQPAALHPIATFMDDPEHAQQPPLNEQNRGVCGLAVSSSADRIVSGSNDMQIKVWDASTGRITIRLGGCMGWPWWVEGLDPELTQVASASTDGFVRVWDLRAGQQSLDVNLNSDPNSSIFPLATVVPRVDGNYLVAGCFDTSIYVIDRRMGSVVKDLRGHTERLARLALRGDSLLSCAFDGDVGLWDF